MPRVPSVGLSPTSRPQFQAPGVIAYGGRPQEMQDAMRLGAGVERMGRVVSQIGLEIEDKVNDARAMEATNVFENGVNKAFLEYQQQIGKNGVDGYEDFQQKIQELQDGAGGMLMNDMQRAAAMPIFDKVRSRVSLRAQEHYMKQAASYKQQQNIAGQIMLQDSIIANPSDPQSLVDFSRFNNLVMDEGRAQGLEGEALEVFALGKRDKLFESIVTAGLDSEDPARIQGVEALMAALPEGIISETQKQALGQLAEKKTLESSAVSWASAGLSQGKSYQDMLEEADALAADNPKLAKHYFRELDARYLAGKRAEADARSDLLQQLSEKIVGGQVLSADEMQQASSQGILFDLEKLQNDIEQERDKTTKEGQKFFVTYDNNIKDLLDTFRSGAHVFEASRRAGLSFADARSLAGQYNRYSQSTAAGQRASGKSNSSRVQFDVLDTDEDQVIETRLFELDSLTAARHNVAKYRDRVKRPYKSDTTGYNYAIRMMVNRFKIDTISIANDLLAQEKEGAVVDRNQILQKAAELAYKRGFLDEEKRQNKYTMEYKYRPDVPEDLAPYMVQARKDEQETLRAESVAQSLVLDPRVSGLPGSLVTRPESLEQLALSQLFDPQAARALNQANIQASSAFAQRTISDYDVQARAEVLRNEKQEADRKREAAERDTARRGIAQQMLSLEPAKLKALLEGSEIAEGRNIFGQKTYTKERKIFGPEWDGQPGFEWRKASFLALPEVRALKEKWQSSVAVDEDFEGEWEDFALQFMPLRKNDMDFMPKQVRDRLNNLPTATDDGYLTRFQALERAYAVRGDN